MPDLFCKNFVSLLFLSVDCFTIESNESPKKVTHVFVLAPVLPESLTKVVLKLA